MCFIGKNTCHLHYVQISASNQLLFVCNIKLNWALSNQKVRKLQKLSKKKQKMKNYQKGQKQRYKSGKLE